jgi:hypothetical protein
VQGGRDSIRELVFVFFVKVVRPVFVVVVVVFEY